MSLSIIRFFTSPYFMEYICVDGKCIDARSIDYVNSILAKTLTLSLTLLAVMSFSFLLIVYLYLDRGRAMFNNKKDVAIVSLITIIMVTSAFGILLFYENPSILYDERFDEIVNYLYDGMTGQEIIRESILRSVELFIGMIFLVSSLIAVLMFLGEGRWVRNGG